MVARLAPEAQKPAVISARPALLAVIALILALRIKISPLIVEKPKIVLYRETELVQNGRGKVFAKGGGGSHGKNVRVRLSLPFFLFKLSVLKPLCFSAVLCTFLFYLKRSMQLIYCGCFIKPARVVLCPVLETLA